MRGKIFRLGFSGLLIGSLLAPQLSALDAVGRPEGGVLARVGDRLLKIEDVALNAAQAAESARFDRVFRVGKYRFELFNAFLQEREAWLDRQVLRLAEFEAGSSSLPSVLTKERLVGLAGLTSAELDEREAYLQGLRKHFACQIEVPPFRVEAESKASPRLGDSGSRVTIVEFVDFRCAACAVISEKLKHMLAEYPGSVSLVDRHFALSARSGDNFRLAEGALCAGEQGKYWEFHDLLFGDRQTDRPVREILTAAAADVRLNLSKFNSCVESGSMADRIIADQEAGAQIGVFGTPTVFVNGRRIMGGDHDAAVRLLIDLELEGRQSPGCPNLDNTK